MNPNNWISRYKFKRKQKQEERMKKKYGFILDKIEESEYRICEKVSNEITEYLKQETEKMDQQINNNMEGMSHHLENLQYRIQDYVIEVKAVNSKNHAIIVEKINSTNDKIEKICVDIAKLQKKAEIAYNEKSDAIILNLDEVKSLLKIVAVNNLLDEINVDELKATKMR